MMAGKRAGGAGAVFPNMGAGLMADGAFTALIAMVAFISTGGANAVYAEAMSAFDGANGAFTALPAMGADERADGAYALLPLMLALGGADGAEACLVPGMLLAGNAALNAGTLLPLLVGAYLVANGTLAVYPEVHTVKFKLDAAGGYRKKGKRQHEHHEKNSGLFHNFLQNICKYIRAEFISTLNYITKSPLLSITDGNFYRPTHVKSPQISSTKTHFCLATKVSFLNDACPYVPAGTHHSLQRSSLGEAVIICRRQTSFKFAVGIIWKDNQLSDPSALSYRVSSDGRTFCLSRRASYRVRQDAHL